VRRLLFPILLAAALAAPAGASAAPRPADLWATVNICDTPRHPNQMGVRASMPGNGRRQSMYMRFRAQFYNADDKTWKDVGGNAISRWIYAGSARFENRQAGFTFALQPPSNGSSFVLRGRVEFQWRERRRSRRTRKVRVVVVRRARANTKAGYDDAAGADPPGFSAGLCQIF
jgi:hypothetical protein